MDARITKQRLGNLLSYDWLKMLGLIAAAVAVLYVLFVMIATRPTIAQVYTVYTYSGLKIGKDSRSLVKNLDGTFSYDILEVEMQNFEDSTMAAQALAARRGMLEGDAVIAANYTEEDDMTPFERIASNYSSYNEETGTCDGYYEIPAFLAETEAYLQDYFGTELKGEPDERAVKSSFDRIAATDKRFKTDAQRGAGLAEERARVKALRENYLIVKAAFADGSLYTVDFTFTRTNGDAEETTLYPFGIGLGNLSGLTDLFYYYSGESATAKDLVLLFFNNGENHVRDAKYENWAFLRYLLDTYAPVHS